MNFASEASKLLTNKYFLYFIAFLAVTNVMGYIVTNKINAVIFFALVCILMINFSKNMTVVLIVAIIATNLLMVNKSMRREGMTSDTTAETDATPDATTVSTDATTADENTHPAIKNAINDLQTTGKVTDTSKTEIKATAKDKVAAKKPTSTTTDATTTDATTTDPVPTSTDEAFTSAGAGFSGKKRGAIGGPVKASRIDYSTTLEQAYDNLDKMLGSDGMNGLSADTEKLMAQQQKLFNAVNTMMPMIDKAQGMIQGLDMNKINSLVGMTDKFGSLGGLLGSKSE